MVLLVEDDHSLLELWQRTLERADFGVITADNGHAALMLFNDGSIDIVVTDILLPGIDGFELIRRLKHKSREVPIVAISGLNDSPRYRQLAESAGAAVALSKPLDRGKLVEVVKALLASHDDLSALERDPLLENRAR